MTQLATARSTRARLGLAGFAVLAAAGCAQPPDLGDTISPAARAAPYPRLLPIEDLLAGTNDTAIPDSLEPELQARAAALKSRAAGLRGPVIEPPIRARMQRGIPR